MTYFGLFSFFGTSKSYASFPTEIPYICENWRFDGQLHLHIFCELILHWYDIFIHLDHIEFEILCHIYCFCKLFLIVSFFGYSLNVLLKTIKWVHKHMGCNSEREKELQLCDIKFHVDLSWYFFLNWHSILNFMFL